MRNNLAEARETRKLLKEIESHCHTTALLTVLAEESIKVALHCVGERVVYDDDPGVREILIQYLVQASRAGCSLVLRSVTEASDAESGLPIKEIRGYYLRREQGVPTWYRLDSDAMWNAFTRDVQTGEYLPAGPDVVFP
jgi:hypothetical protein